jgi:hypothetical protein
MKLGSHLFLVWISLDEIKIKITVRFYFTCINRDVVFESKVTQLAIQLVDSRAYNM